MKSKGPLKDIWDNLKEKWQDSSRDEYRRPNFFQPPDPFGHPMYPMSRADMEKEVEDIHRDFRDSMLPVASIIPIALVGFIVYHLWSITPPSLQPYLIGGSIIVAAVLCFFCYRLMNKWLDRLRERLFSADALEIYYRRRTGLPAEDERPEQSGKGLAEHIAEIREDLRHAPSTPLMGAFLIVALFIVGVFFSLMH
ncbi:MAG: hypothetical protein KC652_00975 [Cyanobacteria bacterium HKST-UBA01]|nr:hypothetical protein [Cyanobacteria bacterium HKST-UBA01]